MRALSFPAIAERARESFPGFLPGKLGHLDTLTGRLRPLELGSPIQAVAYHLSEALPLATTPSGLLIPTEAGEYSKKVPLIPGMFSPYTVELVFMPPPAVPVIFTVNPVIDSTTFRDHPHLLRRLKHPSGSPNDACCVFLPSSGEWNWADPQPSTLIAQTSMWLAAHSIWQATGDWLIPSWGHDPALLKSFLRPEDQCWCGSGVPIKDCEGRSTHGRSIRLVFG